MSLYASGIVRIISEPSSRTFDSGAIVVNFAAGIQEGKDKNGEYIENVIDAEIWGEQSANTFMQYCRSKDCIMVNGVVKMQKWIDKETGKERRKHVLSVQRFEFLPRIKAEEDVF